MSALEDSLKVLDSNLAPSDGSTSDADVKVFVPIISVTLLPILARARGLVLYECTSVVQTMLHFV